MVNFSYQQIEKIIDNYKSGILPKEIAKYFSVEERDIRVVLKDKQLDRQYNTWSDELYQRVIEMHIEGNTHKAITFQLLVSPEGINKTLDRNNIPRMSYTQRNRHYNRNSYYFDEIDTEEKAYFLGLLSSDGHNSIAHRQVIISLQEEDGYLIEAFKNALEYEGPVKFDDRNHRLNPKHKPSYKLAVQDIHLSERLEELGVIKAKSLTYVFPRNIPENQMRHFLRGYFDGDGNIYYDSKRQKGTASIVGTYDFCINVKQILANMGIKSNIFHPKQSFGRNTYIIQTSGTKSTYGLLSWLYDNTTIKMWRKYNRFLQVKTRYEELHSI